MTDCGCDKARTDLEEYLRNEVCNTRHADITEHLENCAECRDKRSSRRHSPRSSRVPARRPRPRISVTRCSHVCGRSRPPTTDATYP